MRVWAVSLLLLLVSVAPSGATVSVDGPDVAIGMPPGDGAAGVIPLFGHDGKSLGYTHGGDPIPSDDDLLPDDAPAVAAAGGTTGVDCAGPDEYYAHLIYARAYDDDDQYAGRSVRMINLANAASDLVNRDAAVHEASIRLRVLCDDDGQPVVSEAVLPTKKSDANYNTIFADLDALGYNAPNVKHWVYYDDQGACRCGGIANILPDDNPTPANLHNGHYAAGGMWAITFDYNSVRVMLHELGHNLGAVSNNAPHTTGAGHCWDGRDIMCYNDGGPTGHLMTNGLCPVQRFDCGSDDYFHPNPPADNFLASHWNLGGIWNRFINHSLRPAAVDDLLSSAVVRQQAPTWMMAPLVDAAATGPGVVGPSLPAGAAEAEYYTVTLAAGQPWSGTVRYVGTTDAVNDFDVAVLLPGALDDGIITPDERIAKGTNSAGNHERVSIIPPINGTYTVMAYGWSIAAPQPIQVTGAAYAGEALVATIAAA